MNLRRISIEDSGPLTGWTLVLAAMVLALSNFMAILDTTIANVSVPHIAGGLAVSPSEGTWVITSYAVAEAITVPLTGWLAMRFGAVRVFTTAAFCFGLCSFLCGLAPTLPLLIVCRILQGLSGGPMMPLSQTLMMRIFPPEKRAQAMGLWSMTAVVGPIAGPLLGGAICDNLSWPWIFFINVPVAAGIVFGATQLLGRYEEGTVRKPVDFMGLSLLIVWVGALQIMLDKGEEDDWFNSPFIVILCLTAIVGFIAFIIWELTQKDPIVNLRLFADKAFRACSLVMALTYGAFFSSVVIVPLWLQTSMGYDALWSGRIMAFQGVLAVMLSPIVAQLVRRIDARAMVTFGVLVISAVMFWRSHTTTGATFWSIATPQLMLGIGMPFFFIALNTIAMGTLKPQDIASGSGLLNFLRTTAGAFAVSLTTSSWSNEGIKARVVLSERLNDPQGVIGQMQNSGFSPGQAVRQIDAMTQQQAVMLATNNVFTVLSICAAIAAFSIWLAPKPVNPVMPGSGGH
jgi:DHA2 family multidrug resistance protein